tara:strand:- start:277 stop:522 length:246 start_codon:yes stop_codon:yes gene_type:complete
MSIKYIVEENSKIEIWENNKTVSTFFKNKYASILSKDDLDYIASSKGGIFYNFTLNNRSYRINGKNIKEFKPGIDISKGGK